MESKKSPSKVDEPKTTANFNFTSSRGRYSYATKGDLGKLVSEMRKGKTGKELRGIYPLAVKKYLFYFLV